MNNSCQVNLTVPYRYTLATVYSVVMLAGLPLNGLSLWIFLKKHGLRTSTTVFMVNLALSDLLLALSLPLRVYYYATMTWPFGAVACTLATIMFRLNIFSSSVFITFISVDRLQAVVFPLRSRQFRTARCATVGCVVAWLLLGAVLISSILRSQQNNCMGKNCFELREATNESTSSRGNDFIIPPLITFSLLTANLLSTAMVMWALYRRQTPDSKFNKRRIMLILGLNVFMFSAFFVPYNIVLINLHLKRTERLKDILSGTVCFATLNCCLDPLIYYFSSDGFRKREVESGTKGHTLRGNTTITD